MESHLQRWHAKKRKSGVSDVHQQQGRSSVTQKHAIRGRSNGSASCVNNPGHRYRNGQGRARYCTCFAVYSCSSCTSSHVDLSFSDLSVLCSVEKRMQLGRVCFKGHRR
ncbi:hypothetical protein MTO96_041883 [Rhipicephalus appendiculatus]